MKVTEKKNEGLKRQYTIILKGEEITNKVDSQLKQIAANTKMAGFRPGKVPVKIVRQKHGAEVLGDVLQREMSGASQKVIQDKELLPALEPKMEIVTKNFEEGKDLEFSLEVEVYPEVPEIDLSKITLKRSKVELTEKDVNEGLDKLKERRKSFEPVKRSRAAKKGDVVNIDFLGKLDGEPFEGGAAEGHDLELGSGQFIPGFEDQLIGAKKGDKKVVKVTFPKEYGSEDLAGKDAEFDVTVHVVKEAVDPEINDEFAKELGFDDAEKLKEAVKEQIEQDLGQVADTKLKKELFDELDKHCKFEIPQGMYDMEYKTLLDNAKIAEDTKDKEEKKQLKELEELALRRVRLGILLANYGRQFKVDVSEDELRQAVFEQARQFQGQEQAVIQWYQQNPQMLEQLKGPLLEGKVVDLLKEKIKITDKKATMQELVEYNESHAE